MVAHKRILVCANPDLNLIDGSSVWAQAISLVLAETGLASVDFLARSAPQRGELFSALAGHANIRLIDGPSERAEKALLPQRLSLSEMVQVAIDLDRDNQYDLIVVRGLEIARTLEKQSGLLSRCWLYLTDIEQTIDGYGADERGLMARLAHGCHRLLCQSQAFVNLWKAIVPDLSDQKLLLYRPVIPEVGTDLRSTSSRAPIAVYAGKFAPEWNTLEMTEAWNRVYRRHPEAKLRMIGDKIHTGAGSFEVRMRSALTSSPGVEWLGAMPREEVLSQLKNARVGLSWRSDLMNDTLEYSTKILEYGSAGCAAILNRNDLHEDLLGEDYPLFANSLQQYLSATESALFNDGLAQSAADRLMKLAGEHTYIMRVKQMKAWLRTLPERENVEAVRARRKIRILVAGHDLKFFLPLQKRLEETEAFEFIVDQWEGHDRHDEEHSRRLLWTADMIFCEWCLGNVKWYSERKRPEQRLLVRFHAQELNTRYLGEANWAAIDLIAFVAPHIQAQFQIQYPDFPESVQTTIPNFVDARKFQPNKKLGDAQFTLGVVGYAPRLKRLDRAVDLLKQLLEQNSRYTLRVKGRNPLDYPWVLSRENEREYYENLFRKINSDPDLRNRVLFDPPGDDVNEWFQMIGHVLSPSDRESFHFALAEGMLTGCSPVIWQRDGVESLWPEHVLAADTGAAAQLVMRPERPTLGYRTFVQERYADSVITSWEQHFIHDVNDSIKRP